MKSKRTSHVSKTLYNFLLKPLTCCWSAATAVSAALTSMTADSNKHSSSAPRVAVGSIVQPLVV